MCLQRYYFFSKWKYKIFLLLHPFKIPLHRKENVKKNPWSKTPCASEQSVSFFDLRSVAAGSQDELQQGLSMRA